MKKLILLASAALCLGCEQRIETPSQPAEKTVEKNTTIVQPAAEKKEEHTTIINPAPKVEEKSQTTTTTTKE